MTSAFLKSASLRIALHYGLGFVLAVVVLMAFIYITTVGFLDRQLDTILESEVSSLQQLFQNEGESALTEAVARQVRRHPDGEVVYLLTDEKGTKIAGNLDEWPSTPVDDDGWTEFLLNEWDYEKETRPGRALTANLSNEFSLLVGRDIGARVHVHRLILDSLLWGLALTILLALGIGVLISARVTNRLEKMNVAAREIMHGDLDRRVPRDESNDDFDQVAINLNRMLDRIQDLMMTIQEISSNVAHDLRRPLTHLIHRLDEAGNAEPEEAHKYLIQAQSDAEQLMDTFDALLRIARIESGERRAEFEPVDLPSMLRDVGELYEPVAQEGRKELNFASDENLTVLGDRNLIFQAIANLVDNAIKFTPEGGAIELKGWMENGQVQLLVADSGPGLPEELHEKVFQRFFRADSSRSTPGNGLGLNLVKAIADLHHAGIQFSDNEPGLKVMLVFKSI